MKEWADQNVEIDLCLVGAKGAAFFNSYGGNVVAAVRDIGEQPAIADLIGSVNIMLDAFSDGTVDKLYIVGHEFVTTMTHSPSVHQLLLSLIHI